MTPPSADSQISDSRLPISACSTSRCTDDVSDCSNRRTPGREERGEDHAHRRTRFDLAGALDQFDQDDGDDRRAAAPSSMGIADTSPVSRNATTIPGRTTWLMASPISAWRRRIRKFPGKRAGDRREDADQDRRQRELDELRTHLGPSTRTGGPIRRSNSRISSAVKTSSIGVRPL
jgi:hypothetical protein